MTKASRPSASLPSYSVRESDRAKNLSLRISRQGHLEVVIPRGYDHHRIPDILRQKQGWIERTTRRILEQQRLHDQEVTVLPQRIELRAIGETWSVTYQPAPLARLTLTEQTGQRLLLRGSTEDIAACRAALRYWLSHRAEHTLAPWLCQVSEEVRLPFNRTTIRGQKTLWASCSCQQNISLNYKLLFLPPRLVQYVFIHELCHTIEMNHSRRFWLLVGEKEPTYELLDRELRQASYYVPSWLDGPAEMQPEI